MKVSKSRMVLMLLALGLIGSGCSQVNFDSVAKTGSKLVNPDRPLPGPDPDDPDVPREPEQPSEPEQPQEPEQPSEPEQPQEPEQPSEPEQPQEPEQPGEPEQPQEPETPPTPPAPPELPVEDASRGHIEPVVRSTYGYPVTSAGFGTCVRHGIEYKTYMVHPQCEDGELLYQLGLTYRNLYYKLDEEVLTDVSRRVLDQWISQSNSNKQGITMNVAGFTTKLIFDDNKVPQQMAGRILSAINYIGSRTSNGSTILVSVGSRGRTTFTCQANLADNYSAALKNCLSQRRQWPSDYDFYWYYVDQVTIEWVP